MSGNSISVSAAIYARLRTYCSEHGIAMRGLLEQMLEPVLTGAAPIASDRNMVAEDRAAVDAFRLRLAASTIHRGLSRLVEIPLSPQLLDEVRVHAVRTGVTTEAALEGAINRMIDHLSSTPWCRACMQTIGDCDCRVAMTGGRR